MQGMVDLTSGIMYEYYYGQEHDRISVLGLNQFAPGKPLYVILKHQDGTTETFEALHTYNEMQIRWFKAGSALNTIRAKE